MVLKSSVGNRGFGWDLLPPGSESWEQVDPKTGKTYMTVGNAMGADMVNQLKK